jgi:hypothetical protein
MRDALWGCIGCGGVCERKSGPPLYRVAGTMAPMPFRNATTGRSAPATQP